LIVKVYQVDPAGQSPATGEAGAEALDVGAVSRLYACSPRHATRMAAVGDIPAGFRLGNLRRWSRVAIIEDIARKQAAAVTGGRD
jgi:hypothetical protein